MPDPDNPNGLACDAVEEAVRADDDLPIRKIRKLRKNATGFREPLEPAQRSLSPLLEPPGASRILKEPPSAGGREPDAQQYR
jgi:hypothetical protein